MGVWWIIIKEKKTNENNRHTPTKCHLISFGITNSKKARNNKCLYPKYIEWNNALKATKITNHLKKRFLNGLNIAAPNNSSFAGILTINRLGIWFWRFKIYSKYEKQTSL